MRLFCAILNVSLLIRGVIMGVSMESSIARLSFDMAKNSLGNQISVSLLGKSIVQSAAAAGAVLEMLPTAAPNEIGGLLDTRG
jgi:hypothetical protein